MVQRLESFDRNILEFRPSIAFIEPDAEEQVIEPVETPFQLEDVKAGRARVKQLAKAVNTMAAAIQARADQRAASLIIQLDENVDQETVQAMRRKFPGEDPTRISYAQYREVKDGIRNRGIEVGRQGIIQPEEVAAARDEINTFIPGGFGTEEANTGGLRPELDPRMQIIPPLDIQEIQINLICILVNFIWSRLIKPFIVSSLGSLSPIAIAFSTLPDEICDPGSSIDIPGLLILGDEPDDLLSGKVSVEETAEALRAAEEVGL